MFERHSTYRGIRFGPVARQLAEIVLLLVLVASITALSLSLPTVTAEIGDNRQDTTVASVPEYPNVSPTAQSVWR